MRQNVPVAKPSVSNDVSESESRTRLGYGFLLVAVVASYLLSVVGSDSEISYSILILVQLTTVWLALRVSEAQTLSRVAGVGLLVLGLGVVVTIVRGESSVGLQELNTWWFLLSTVLYLVAPTAIVRHIVRLPRVDLEALLGVISAYLMIGMSFAFVFRILGVWQPGDFFGPAGDGSLADDLFFSFTSLTTVGYGNLVPAGNPGQTLAVFEAMMGQLFLVIVVAKVVTNMSRSTPPAPTPAEPEPSAPPEVDPRDRNA